MVCCDAKQKGQNKNAMMVFKGKDSRTNKTGKPKKREKTNGDESGSSSLPPPNYGRRSKIARTNILQLLHSTIHYHFTAFIPPQ